MGIRYRDGDGDNPVKLMVVIDDYYHTFNVDYHDGAKIPHLVRDDAKPDYLDELIKPHATTD